MSHPPYEILEHTADVGLKAYAPTLPELFVNAARGMLALALEPPVASVPSGVEGSEVEPQEMRPSEFRKLSARGEDRGFAQYPIGLGPVHLPIGARFRVWTALGGFSISASPRSDASGPR